MAYYSIHFTGIHANGIYKYDLVKVYSKYQYHQAVVVIIILLGVTGFLIRNI